MEAQKMDQGTLALRNSRSNLAAVPRTAIQRTLQEKIADARTAAEFAIQTGLVGGDADARAVAQIALKIMSGAELGLDLYASLKAFHIIPSKNGTVQIERSASLIAAQIEASPHFDYVVDKLNNEECTIHFYRNGKFRGTQNYTIDDANQAKLVQRTNTKGYPFDTTWQLHPSDMLFAACLRRGAKRYCAGVEQVRLDGIVELACVNEFTDCELIEGRGFEPEIKDVIDSEECSEASEQLQPDESSFGLEEILPRLDGRCREDLVDKIQAWFLENPCAERLANAVDRMVNEWDQDPWKHAKHRDNSLHKLKVGDSDQPGLESDLAYHNFQKAFNRCQEWLDKRFYDAYPDQAPLKSRDRPTRSHKVGID